jgi:hypothetical protein
MKKLLAIVIAVAFCATIQAAPQILLGSLVSVNGTSNSQVVALSPLQVSFQVFNFQNGGLTDTNAAALKVQISTDGTNYTTSSTYLFPQTNSGGYTYYAPSTNVQVYLRVQAVTTNAVLLGGSYGN